MNFPGLGIADVVATQGSGAPLNVTARPHFDGHDERGRIRVFYSQCPLDQEQVRELIRGTGLTVVQARYPDSTGYTIVYGRGMVPPPAGSTLTARELYDNRTRSGAVEWSVRDQEGQNGPGALIGGIVGFALGGIPGIIVFTAAGAFTQEAVREHDREDPTVKSERVLNTMSNAAPYGVSCALARPLAPGVGLRQP